MAVSSKQVFNEDDLIRKMMNCFLIRSLNLLSIWKRIALIEGRDIGEEEHQDPQAQPVVKGGGGGGGGGVRKRGPKRKKGPRRWASRRRRRHW